MGEFVQAAQRQEQVDNPYISSLLNLMMQQKKMQFDKELQSQRIAEKRKSAEDWRNEERKWKAHQKELEREYQKLQIKESRKWQEKQTKEGWKHQEKQTKEGRKWQEKQTKEGWKHQGKLIQEGRKYQDQKTQSKRKYQEQQIKESRKWKEQQTKESRKWKEQQTKEGWKWRSSESKKDRKLRQKIADSIKQAKEKAQKANENYRKQQEKEHKEITAAKENYKVVAKRQQEKYKNIFDTMKLQKKAKNEKEWMMYQKQIDEASKDFMSDTLRLKKYREQLKARGVPFEEQGVPENEWTKTLKFATGENPMNRQRALQQQQIKKESNKSKITNYLYKSPFYGWYGIPFVQRLITGLDEPSPIEEARMKAVGDIKDITVPPTYNKIQELYRKYKGLPNPNSSNLNDEKRFWLTPDVEDNPLSDRYDPYGPLYKVKYSTVPEGLLGS